MSKLPKEYFGLMRDALQDDTPTNRTFKRRKRNQKGSSVKNNDSSIAVIDLDSQSSKEPTPAVPNDDDAIEIVGIKDLPGFTSLKRDVINISDNDAILNKTVDEFNDDDNDDGDDDDDDDDDEEFEDIDLDNLKPRASSNLTSDVVVSYDNSKAQQKTSKKKLNIIDREERIFRKNFHRNYIALMSIHGFIRNTWCSNRGLQNHLLKLVSPSIYKELHPPKDITRTRKFLDGLRHLMGRWAKYYKVTANKGIFRHDWYDWYDFQRSRTDFARFSRCLTKGRGNRDIGAQGFVCLLRAAGVPSRLVFSLQPPDFTSKQIKEKKSLSEKVKPSSLSIQEKVIALRKNTASSTNPTQAEVEMKYPVFWAEAWDSASKTWISIDPIMFKIVENVKTKSQLEPPSQYPYNNLLYVIGYDRKGGVRDITKRYSEKYYAKTRKKRITKEESQEIWFEEFLSGLSKRSRNKSDDYEDEYFAQKAAKEGMPDNIQDFLNHPFYVLEMHLKSNEVLYPKEPCGTIRLRTKNETIPVFKRSNVQQLKSPRGWFHVGRVLRSGQQALKIKQKNPAHMRDDEDDKEERLYAEYQTELYNPPPIVDGQITKNAYGNLDIYVPSMVPAGGVLLNSTYAEDAAKAIGIDYAAAVIGFKFDRRQVTPKFGGIVIAAEYREAVEAVEEQLENEALEKQRWDLETRALKGWNLLITKIRIKQRLNKTHGKVQEKIENFEGRDSEDELDKLEQEYEQYLNKANSGYEDKDEDNLRHSAGGSTNYDKDTIDLGGFLAEDADFDQPTEHLDTGGGFLLENDDTNLDNGAGFLIESDIDDSNDNIQNQDMPYDTRGAVDILRDDENIVDTDSHKTYKDSHKESQSIIERTDYQDGDLSDFESFFEGLDDLDQGYESDQPFISIERNTQLPTADENEVEKHMNNENNSKVPKTVKEDVSHDVLVDSSDNNNTSGEQVYLRNDESSNPLDSQLDTPLDNGNTELQSRNSNQHGNTNGPEFDQDLEREFEEQLRREKELALKVSNDADDNLHDSEDDFGFDYESN